jgi:hypothetical protein
MPSDVVNFDAFKFDRYFWIGKHNVRWLANPTSFLVMSESQAIPDVQRDAIRFVCGLPLETRDKLERRLFEEYQSRIYNSYSGGDAITPPLQKPEDIWKLLEQPGIMIPEVERLSAECQFVATFECPWNPEHGLGILFNHLGSATEVGAPGDYR